jgi:hypothetical protein
MGWAEWMIVELPVEEQLTLEKQARVPLHQGSTDQIRQLCSSLIRQNHMQQKLLKQATGRIIELEAMAACLDIQT